MVKSLSLASYNWKVLLKSLVCQIGILALVLALGFVLFGDTANDILRVFSESKISEFVSYTVSSIFEGNFVSEQFTAELNAVIANLQKSIASINYTFGGPTLSYIMFFVVICLYRVTVAFTDVTVTCQLDEFMTSCTSRPFTWFLLKKQGKTWKFALLQAAFALPLDILVLTGCIGLYLLFLIAFNWWTIIPVGILAMLLYTARVSLFSFCLPSVVCEDVGVCKAFSRGISQAVVRYWRVFWKTLIVIAVMTAVTILSLLYIENTWISTAVLSAVNFALFFLLKCVNIVEYFNANDRPYFHKRVYVEGTDCYNKRQRRLAKKSK